MFSMFLKRKLRERLKETFKLRGSVMTSSNKNAKKNQKTDKSRNKTIEPLEMHESSGNVFSDIGFSDAEADSLHIRSCLMIEIEKIIKANGWTQAQAAEILGISQPRISDIVSDRVSLFAIDTLVKYLSILGKRVLVNVENKDVA
jgi:predicted XRE-type DNA-binding protein